MLGSSRTQDACSGVTTRHARNRRAETALRSRSLGVSQLISSNPIVFTEHGLCWLSRPGWTKRDGVDVSDDKCARCRHTMRAVNWIPRKCIPDYRPNSTRWMWYTTGNIVTNKLLGDLKQPAVNVVASVGSLNWIKSSVLRINMACRFDSYPHHQFPC